MSYVNLATNLDAYTDQVSFEAISNAVLQTSLMEYATLRSGLRAGTTAVNILDVDIAAQARSCSWSDNATVEFTQVDIVMNELESKQSLCPTSLREYYLSEKLSGSAHAAEIPFEDIHVIRFYTTKQHNSALATSISILPAGLFLFPASTQLPFLLPVAVTTMYFGFKPFFKGNPKYEFNKNAEFEVIYN